MPEIGPNYEIISQYRDKYLEAQKLRQEIYHFVCEPVVVERLYPDGYQIVNGHHRWAAALMMGISEIPIEIVNLTHEGDVEKILEKSGNEKRAVLDLDEVIFRETGDAPLEPPLPFPWSRIYKERMRLGVPALLHALSQNGYDIWVYSSRCYSTDTVQNIFRRYHVKADGVMTAAGKRTSAPGSEGKSIEQQISKKYRDTVHIDNGAVLQILSETKEFREFCLSGDQDLWSQEILDVLEKIRMPEKESKEQP